MASKTKPAAGQDAPGERPDAASSKTPSTDGVAPGSDAGKDADAADAAPGGPAVQGGATTASPAGAPEAASASPPAAAPVEETRPADGVQILGERGIELTAPVPVATLRSARPILDGLSDHSGLGIAALAEEARAESRDRRHREIPAEGIAIPAHHLDALAVHLDLEPGTVIAARQYPDRLVTVTRDGRKLVKDMG